MIIITIITKTTTIIIITITLFAFRLILSMCWESVVFPE